MEQYKVNSYGAKIKMCCASCVHSSIKDEDVRCCGLTKDVHRPSDVCIAWEVRPKLMNAGKGGGWLRSKEVILAEQEKRLKEGRLSINYTQLKMDGTMRKTNRKALPEEQG